MLMCGVYVKWKERGKGKRSGEGGLMRGYTPTVGYELQGEPQWPMEIFFQCDKGGVSNNPNGWFNLHRERPGPCFGYAIARVFR